MLPQICYNNYMKKMKKEEVVELLKNKNNLSYNELASISGYHPKSLIRLNKILKQNNYEVIDNKLDIKKNIINDYLKSNYKSYKEFYKFGLTYDISYSSLCKILSNIKTDEEITIIKKIKTKENYHFEIIDYKSESLLFKFPSLKNDKKSFKEIFYLILKEYGLPNNVVFINFFKIIPEEIQSLLNKYNINILEPKTIYRLTPKSTNKVFYKKVSINNYDFYNSTTRKTIAVNTIQFKNIRYLIDTAIKINKNEEITLYYNNPLTDLFIEYKNEHYKLKKVKEVISKKGDSKYN